MCCLRSGALARGAWRLAPPSPPRPRRPSPPRPRRALAAAALANVWRQRLSWRGVALRLARSCYASVGGRAPSLGAGLLSVCVRFLATTPGVPLLAKLEAGGAGFALEVGDGGSGLGVALADSAGTSTHEEVGRAPLTDGRWHHTCLVLQRWSADPHSPSTRRFGACASPAHASPRRSTVTRRYSSAGAHRLCRGRHGGGRAPAGERRLRAAEDALGDLVARTAARPRGQPRAPRLPPPCARPRHTSRRGLPLDAAPLPRRALAQPERARTHTAGVARARARRSAPP